MSTPVAGKSTKSAIPGVTGEATKFEGVRGISHAAGHGGVVGINDVAKDAGPGVYGTSPATGVWGESTGTGWHGVFGTTPSKIGGAGVWGENTENGPGVVGKSGGGMGVVGESQENEGVRGTSHASWHAGVVGVNTHIPASDNPGPGVYGTSTGAGVVGESTAVGGGRLARLRSSGWHGVYGRTPSTSGGAGVMGENTSSGVGVFGKSASGEGVHGETNSRVFAAVAGIQLSARGTGAGIYGESRGPGPAGFFKGNVVVTGDVFLPGSDCAEEFEVAAAAPGSSSSKALAEPGTVMVIEGDGALRPSTKAYDRRVAGVVSGAGTYKAGIVLGSGRKSRGAKAQVALVGRTFCKVDARYSPIAVGDLLTTSPTAGHAMKAKDQARAFGAVIGKAMRPLAKGKGLIPILIALQ